MLEKKSTEQGNSITYTSSVNGTEMESSTNPKDLQLHFSPSRDTTETSHIDNTGEELSVNALIAHFGSKQNNKDKKKEKSEDPKIVKDKVSNNLKRKIEEQKQALERMQKIDQRLETLHYPKSILKTLSIPKKEFLISENKDYNEFKAETEEKALGKTPTTPADFLLELKVEKNKRDQAGNKASAIRSEAQRKAFEIKKQTGGIKRKTITDFEKGEMKFIDTTVEEKMGEKLIQKMFQGRGGNFLTDEEVATARMLKGTTEAEKEREENKIVQENRMNRELKELFKELPNEDYQYWEKHYKERLNNKDLKENIKNRYMEKIEVIHKVKNIFIQKELIENAESLTQRKVKKKEAADKLEAEKLKKKK